ncbi:hypothetical protein SAMN02745830_07257 [Streptomyces sp. Amel2xC10]|nr:hypothetical protein SAMN02745830_07257 [Streptomyces sp. Amel2xC10]
MPEAVHPRGEHDAGLERVLRQQYQRHGLAGEVLADRADAHSDPLAFLRLSNSANDAFSSSSEPTRGTGVRQLRLK